MCAGFPWPTWLVNPCIIQFCFSFKWQNFNLNEIRQKRSFLGSPNCIFHVIRVLVLSTVLCVGVILTPSLHSWNQDGYQRLEGFSPNISSIIRELILIVSDRIMSPSLNQTQGCDDLSGQPWVTWSYSTQITGTEKTSKIMMLSKEEQIDISYIWEKWS